MPVKNNGPGMTGRSSMTKKSKIEPEYPQWAESKMRAIENRRLKELQKIVRESMLNLTDAESRRVQRKGRVLEVCLHTYRPIRQRLGLVGRLSMSTSRKSHSHFQQSQEVPSRPQAGVRLRLMF